MGIEVYDIEAAFLNAKPGGRMYIKIPDAMVELGFVTREEQELFAILLGMNMYGNIDVALRFFEKYQEILVENFTFLQCQMDLCIFYKHDKKGRLCMLISMHVDDSLIGRWQWMVEKFYVEFAEHLKIEILRKLKKHFGCMVGVENESE